MQQILFDGDRVQSRLVNAKGPALGQSLLIFHRLEVLFGNLQPTTGEADLHELRFDRRHGQQRLLPDSALTIGKQIGELLRPSRLVALGRVGVQQHPKTALRFRRWRSQAAAGKLQQRPRGRQAVGAVGIGRQTQGSQVGTIRQSEADRIVLVRHVGRDHERRLGPVKRSGGELRSQQFQQPRIELLDRGPQFHLAMPKLQTLSSELGLGDRRQKSALLDAVDIGQHRVDLLAPALKIVDAAFRFDKPQENLQSVARGQISFLRGLEPEQFAGQRRAARMQAPSARLRIGGFGLQVQQVGNRGVAGCQALGRFFLQGTKPPVASNIRYRAQRRCGRNVGLDDLPLDRPAAVGRQPRRSTVRGRIAAIPTGAATAQRQPKHDR